MGEIIFAPLQGLPEGLTLSDALSLLLTLVLAGLYLLIWKTQQRQADIQERQAGFDERQVSIQETQNEILTRQAGILAVDYEPELSMSSSNDASISIQRSEGRDVFLICLSNRGRGKARDLTMGCAMYLKQEADELEPTYTPAWMVPDRDYSINSESNNLIRVETQSDEERELIESTIEAGETGVWYNSEVIFLIDPRDKSPYRVTFSEVANRILLEWGISKIGLEFYVAYSDAIGRGDRGMVASVEDIRLREDMTLEAAIEAGKSTGRHIRNFVPDEYLDEDLEDMAEDMD